MTSHRKVNPYLKQNNDTGFSSNTDNTGGRFINKDGSYNLEKEGMPFIRRFSLFHDMLNLSNWKFALVILAFYFVINLAYTTLYLMVGFEHFEGLEQGSYWKRSRELFYFSTQTFTTVGYGHVYPKGDPANIIGAIESLTGLLSLAIGTGLIYGRFSKPRSYLVFSDVALVSPFKGGNAVMFRFAAYKDKHTLTDLEIRVNTGLLVMEEEKPVYKYFTLSLERTRVESMPLSWTVVHQIDENSPFWGFTEPDMENADVELYVNLRGFDEVFSNYVQQRTSYTFREIQFDRKWVPMYRESPDSNSTILELQKLNIHVDAKAAQK